MISFMFFDSLNFIFLFLPSTLLFYFFLNHNNKFKLSKVLLMLCNILFYSMNDLKHLPFIIFSMFFNFFITKNINKVQKNNNTKISCKFYLNIGLLFNILLLLYSKYTNSLMIDLNTSFGVLKFNIKNIVSPLAISFFTFHQITYLMDSYNGIIEEQNFLDYSVFITFFPNIVMGPITHYNNIVKNINNKHENSVLNNKNLFLGISLFIIGLIKKIILANNLSFWVNNGFDVAKDLNIIEAWLVSISYTFQIYFDFSGYSDMAIGLALMFNINLPINFNSPYKAINIQDFWHRWHITLSNFWQQYIYIPLGGSRKGEIRTYLNILIVFFISGIWHGAGNTYIIWGLIHGFAMVANRLWKKINIVDINDKISRFITFIFINFTWIIFRSKNIKVAHKVLKAMFNFKSLSNLKNFDKVRELIPNIGGKPKHLSLYLISSLIVSKFLINSNEIIDKIEVKNKSEAVILGCLLSVIFLIAVLFIIIKPYHEFIYSNF